MRVKHTIAAIATLIVLSGCDDAQTDAQQGAAPPPPTVTVATPLVKELIEFDEVTGRFEAVEDVIIRARVTGYVDSINFNDGQMVEAGQVLFTIDPRTYQADVAGARADLIAAETSQKLAASELARLSKLTSGRTVTEPAPCRSEDDGACRPTGCAHKHHAYLPAQSYPGFPWSVVPPLERHTAPPAHPAFLLV